MGRPPSNGGPSFRFNPAEIMEMESILQAHKIAMPAREVLVSLAEKFSNSEERKGKIEVQMKQVWNWFQNRRYAIRAKAAKSPAKSNMTQMAQNDSSMAKSVPPAPAPATATQPHATQPHVASSTTARSLPQGPQQPTVPSAAVRTFPQAPQHPPAFTVQSVGRFTDNSQMEYEAKSARDGAWYDVSTFLSHRSLETGDPEVLVRFAGFGAEEDEWVNVRKNVRQRSLPCESSECVAVLPADLILCFQEGKEQALYFDAHVLDAQRRRHDVRGCRCRFLVRYDHDQSEEIVALRKICRRPETDYRLQQLHAVNESLSANHNKNGGNNFHTVSTLRVYPPAEVPPQQHKVEPTVSSSSVEVPQKRQRIESTVPAPQPEGSELQKVQVKPDPLKIEIETPVNGKLEESVVLGSSSVEVPTELHEERETKAEETVVRVVTSDCNAVEDAMETEAAEAGSTSGPGVDEEIMETKTKEQAAPISTGDPNIVEEPVGTEAVEPGSTSGPGVDEEAMETETKEQAAPVSTDDSNMVEEPVGKLVTVVVEEPVGSEAVEHGSTSGPNVVEEAMETKAKEQTVPVSTDDCNMVEETEAEEPGSTSGPSVVEETEANEPVVPGSTISDPTVEV